MAELTHTCCNPAAQATCCEPEARAGYLTDLPGWFPPRLPEARGATMKSFS
jgi:hypothetical protein